MEGLQTGIHNRKISGKTQEDIYEAGSQRGEYFESYCKDLEKR